MILIIGGTGYVGSRVTERLIAQGQHELRVFARGRADWESSVLPRFRRKGVDIMVGDIADKKKLDKALTGCKAIVNCAGVMRAESNTELEDTNLEGVKNLIHLGHERGVQRFIQLSCLGATEHSTCRYLQTKWQAENLLRKSSFYWTIFRPSLIFGAGSHLHRILHFWVGRSPIAIVVGSGLNRMQPVSGDDVADCIVQSVYNRDTVNRTFDLMGPESIYLKEMLTLTANAEGKSGQVLKIPSFVGVRIAALMGKLNKQCPIDGEVMRVLTSDLVTDPDEPIGEIFEMKGMPYSDIFKQKKQTGAIEIDSSKKKRRKEEDEDEDEYDDDEDDEDENDADN